MTTVTPVILWAQRSSATEAEKNLLYITIQVQDATNIKLDLTATGLEFNSDSSDDKKHYHLKVDFFGEVDPENSRQNTESGLHVYLVIRKKEKKEEYWPRLTKDKIKLHWIKTDFDKWVDEDEQDEQPEQDDNLGDMASMMGGGAGGMPGMGGMGGMPGMPDLGAMGGMGGGPGGVDFSQLLQGMGGGAGGPGGNFDISQLASQLGQAGDKFDGLDDEAEEGEEKVEEIKK